MNKDEDNRPNIVNKDEDNRPKTLNSKKLVLVVLLIIALFLVAVISPSLLFLCSFRVVVLRDRRNLPPLSLEFK